MTNGFGITIDDQLDQAMNEESHFVKRLTELASWKCIFMAKKKIRYWREIKSTVKLS